MARRFSGYIGIIIVKSSIGETIGSFIEDFMPHELMRGGAAHNSTEKET